MAKRRRRNRKNAKGTAPNSRSLVDVLIPVHGRFDLLQKCLDALPNAFGNIPYRVLIWDNASPDAGMFYRQLPREIKVYESKHNLMFAKACNELYLKWGRSPLLFFLNSDVILDRGAGAELVKEMDDPKVGICGMKLRFPEDSGGLNQTMYQRPPGKVQHTGISFNITGDPHHVFLGWSVDNPKVLRMREVVAVTGAALMTRKTLFDQAKGFFEPYIATWEDVHYCFQVKEMGYNVIVSQDATGVHYTGASAETYGIRYPLQRNKTIFYDQWEGKVPWTDLEYL